MKSMRASLAAVPLLVLSAVQAQESRDGIVWHSDLAEARRLAAEKQAPMFVVVRCEA